MNIESKYVLPDFVANADPSAFDSTEPGAFSVAGYRLDNPAGIWKAAADVRSGAVTVASATANLIKQACALFNITEDQFIVKQASTEPPLTISDGTHTVSFNICDNESLNKAASELISSRPNMSYAFAHDCAHTIETIAKYANLTLDKDKYTAIRKMAGSAIVDFDELKSMVEGRAAEADRRGLKAEAGAFRKLAAQCTAACPVELVPNILEVVDRFDQEHVDLSKSANFVKSHIEDRAFMSQAEYSQKRAAEKLNVDGFNKVARAAVDSAVRSGVLYKWAADNGYTVSSGSSAEDVVALVQRMPRALRQEFISIVG